MDKIIRDKIENKRVLILGYGREGKSTYKYIREHQIPCSIGIYDAQEIELLDTKTKYESDFNVIYDYDIIIKTPGISFKDVDIERLEGKIYSQLEFFIEAFKNQMVGITGTKGKSTTTSLIYELAKKAGKKAVICGNIGLPAFEVAEGIDNDTVVVCEMSSHQLEFIKTSPKIAVLTNIYQEHLDHYKNFEGYINAKLNIARYQKPNDVLIYNVDNSNITEHMKNMDLKESIVKVSKKDICGYHMIDNEIYYGDECIFKKDEKRKLLGEHNTFDMMLTFAVAKELGINNQVVRDMIAEFNGLPHRLEYVCKIGGAKYYNDSISTIPETCMAAVNALENVDTIIIGGKDRGIDYSKLIDFINNIEGIKVICIDEVGKKIIDSIQKEKYQLDDMKDIVKKAVEITKNICLLSPAASSYGHYKNFEERGSLFKEELQKYMK